MYIFSPIYIIEKDNTTSNEIEKEEKTKQKKCMGSEAPNIQSKILRRNISTKLSVLKKANKVIIIMFHEKIYQIVDHAHPQSCKRFLNGHRERSI